MMRPSKLDLVVIYVKPLRYSVFVLRVWKYPTPNANKEYILTHARYLLRVWGGVTQSV